MRFKFYPQIFYKIEVRVCDGHSNTLTLLSLSHFATTLEVCLGSFSIWYWETSHDRGINERKCSGPQTGGEETEPAPSSKPEPNPQQDPLKWFGILVPQTLKQAQASFKQGRLLSVWYDG
uniref:Uncharacterized protein n=1 Tax=Hucho hucho TaxID=62062 RepID=A0A4W5KNQ3_9TELE